jgi:hypothetical protein
MSSKVLFYLENASDLNALTKDYQGVYFKTRDDIDIERILNLSSDYELFFDTLNLDLNECFMLASKLLSVNATFVCDDIQKCIFIKSVNPNFKISFYQDGYNEDFILLAKANGWDITIKYTALAPERIKKFHDEDIKVNGFLLTRLDEVGILKYWNADYITANNPK